MRYLITMFAVVILTFTGCEGNNVASTPGTTPSTYKERITSLEQHKKVNELRWEAQAQYDEQEPDRICEAIRARLSGVSPSGVAAGIETSTPTSATLTSLGTQPTARSGSAGPTTGQHSDHTHTCTGNIPAGTASPVAASYDLPPHLAAYVKERFDKSDAKQTEILGKEDTIIGKLDEVATAVKGLTDKVTKIEQRLPATNSPVRPKPEVPQPE